MPRERIDIHLMHTNMKEFKSDKKFEREFVGILKAAAFEYPPLPTDEEIREMENQAVPLRPEQLAEMRDRCAQAVRTFKRETAESRNRLSAVPIQAEALFALNRKIPEESYSNATKEEIKRLRVDFITKCKSEIIVPKGGFQYQPDAEPPTILRPKEVEALADEVLETWEITKPPVNLIEIAKQENIAMLEGNFGPDFVGRIEFLREVNAYALFYPRLKADLFSVRVRFSIAHELAHYYIPSHRDLLRHGMFHNSVPRIDKINPLERQANAFAATLLVPTVALKARIHRNEGRLNLRQILDFSKKCEASAQTTAFRYVEFVDYPIMAVVTEAGRVTHCFSSPAAKKLGFRLHPKALVPIGPTKDLATSTSAKVLYQTQPLRAWLPDKRRSSLKLWEEAVRLGNTNRILTLLSKPEE